MTENCGFRATFESAGAPNATRFVGNRQNRNETAINLQERKEVARYGSA